jgi:hypothetical protein
MKMSARAAGEQEGRTPGDEGRDVSGLPVPWETQTIEFQSLPKSVRARFVAITNGTGGPAPFFAERASTKSKVISLSFLAVVLALVVAGMLASGVGHLHDYDFAIHGPWYVLFAYTPLMFALVLAVLVIVQRKGFGSPFPFQPGRYLFATDFVDARSGTLRIVPTRLLSDFKGTHMEMNGAYTYTLLTFTFQGGTEQFSIRGEDTAQAAINAFWDSQEALSAAAQAQDWQAIEKLDPFFECRMQNTWETGTPADGGPRVRALPTFFRWRVAIAAGAALVLCPLIVLVRNYVSDERMFESAKSFDTEYTWGQYVSNGWRHQAEAALAQPIAAFREAKKDAAVWRMRRVLKLYPGSSIEADARAALHGLYMKTFADFRSKASTADPRMLPFMARLIDYLEKNDTATVRVVFSPPSTRALAGADALFQREYSRGGKVVEPISAHFERESSSPRESSIVSRLNSGFVSIFPSDVLTLEQVAAGATPSGTEPSISIAYEVGPSGRAYVTDDQQRVFVGIDVSFEMRMTIPGDAQLFDFSLKVSPPKSFSYSFDRDARQSEAAYSAMAERAFDEFTQKLHAVFFKKQGAASH